MPFELLSNFYCLFTYSQTTLKMPQKVNPGLKISVCLEFLRKSKTSFSCNTFSISGFTVRIKICLNLILGQGARNKTNFLMLHMDSLTSQQFKLCKESTWLYSVRGFPLLFQSSYLSWVGLNYWFLLGWVFVNWLNLEIHLSILYFLI